MDNVVKFAKKNSNFEAAADWATTLVFKLSPVDQKLNTVVLDVEDETYKQIESELANQHGFENVMKLLSKF